MIFIELCEISVSPLSPLSLLVLVPMSLSSEVLSNNLKKEYIFPLQRIPGHLAQNSILILTISIIRIFMSVPPRPRHRPGTWLVLKNVEWMNERSYLLVIVCEEVKLLRSKLCRLFPKKPGKTKTKSVPRQQI